MAFRNFLPVISGKSLKFSVLFFLLAPTIVSAQMTNVGRISGTVSDTAQAVIPGAAITVPSQDVDTVVTEYGVAELRGKSVRERMQALVADLLTLARLEGSPRPPADTWFELGEVIGNEYIVLSGLKAGDALIVSGIQKIADGAPVRAE